MLHHVPAMAYFSWCESSDRWGCHSFPTRLSSDLVMMVNNELGSLTDIRAIGQCLRTRGVLFHVDGAQAAGKLPVDVADLEVDLRSEEHTSELQSRENLVCRLLPEKKNTRRPRLAA